MRSIAIAFLLSCVVVTMAQQQRPRTNPPSACGDQSLGIPAFYYEAVVSHFEPPGFHKSLISIAEGAEIKVVLVTDGEKFELWTDTPNTPQENVNEFLLNLDQSCRLPPDPADAANLIKVKWESKELSSDQFAQLHRAFTTALSQYVVNAQNRYNSLIVTPMLSIYTDAIRYPIVYYNNQEHIEVEAWDIPEDPIVAWVHKLKKLAEDKFHRPFEPNTSK